MKNTQWSVYINSYFFGQAKLDAFFAFMPACEYSLVASNPSSVVQEGLCRLM